MSGRVKVRAVYNPWKHGPEIMSEWAEVRVEA